MQLVMFVVMCNIRDELLTIYIKLLCTL